MKKLTTVSLFIFGVIVTAILVAGLVFYQNKKDNQVSNSSEQNLVKSVISKNGIPSTTQTTTKSTTTGEISQTVKKSLTLNMAEIKKHNNRSDCWMLISGKVYDITSFFGSHPGGNGTLLPSCGTDATVAFDTKDPNATSNPSGGVAHSSRADAMLNNYYIGNLDQTISN